MRIKWTDRRFSFDFPAGIYPEMIERIRGTPARLEELFAGLPSETLKAQIDGRWSMQENAGHLLDLESLVHNASTSIWPAVQRCTPPTCRIARPTTPITTTSLLIPS